MLVLNNCVNCVLNDCFIVFDKNYKFIVCEVKVFGVSLVVVDNLIGEINILLKI